MRSDETDPARRRYPELAGRVAVVTGAAKGIGSAIAVRLATEGMRLLLTDIDGEALSETAVQLRELGAESAEVVGDIGEEETVDAVFAAAFARFSNVDLLVNNAADLRRHRLLDDGAGSLLDRQLATNVRGPYLCSRAAAGIMQMSGGGVIVHLSSVGALRAHHRGFPYDVTKGAIDAMTRAMAVDLGEHGIRVNAVAPGVVRTHRPVDPESARLTAERIPLGRSGTAEDVAAVVAFLASDDAAYITGQVVYVDGGITAQLSPRGRDGLEGSDREAPNGRPQ